MPLFGDLPETARVFRLRAQTVRQLMGGRLVNLSGLGGLNIIQTRKFVSRESAGRATIDEDSFPKARSRDFRDPMTCVLKGGD